MTVFADLRVALEDQRAAIAERLEAALARLHDVLAMPFLPLPGLTGRVEAFPGLPNKAPADPEAVACAPPAGQPEPSPAAGTSREAEHGVDP